MLGIHGFDLERALKASPELLNVHALPTNHDKSITSVSLDQGAARHLRTLLAGDLDLTQSWFEELLREQGSDIYRMKGVLAIAHASQKCIYHGAYRRFMPSLYVIL